MIVTRLKLANVRAIETAEFHFQPGMNLIVGVNGVGKTTALHAISRGLAHAIEAGEGTRTTPPKFTENDVRYGALTSNMTLYLDVGGSALQVVEDWIRSGAPATRPGELASDVDVHAKDVRRRGRLRQAQREASTTPTHEEGPLFLPGKIAFKSSAREERSRLLSVFFSTTRAVAPKQTARKSRAVRPSAAAYTDAFVGRELGVGAFAEWLKVLRATSHEREDAGPTLRALDEAVRRFLPGYLGLRVSEDDPPHLLIDKTARATVHADKLPLSVRQRLVQVLRRMREHMDVNWSPDEIANLPPSKVAEAAAAERESVVDRLLRLDVPGFETLRGPLDQVPPEISEESYFDEFYKTLGPHFTIERLPQSLDVAQLSDGERGSLALVLDLTRRLAQANPDLRDPAAEGEGVVLIDELELHLHPKWQRTIVGSLTATFPRCQFIATTHSPQIIGEVEHERVQILWEGGVYFATHSYGVDSSRVLEEVMDSTSRTPEAQKLISQASQAVGAERFDEARLLVEKLEKLTENPNDAEVTRLRALLDFAEGRD